MKSLLVRAAVTGLALWLVTRMVSGIYFVFPVGATQLERVGIILVVAFVFGLVNAIIKPIVQLFAIPLYILTLGLISLIVNVPFDASTDSTTATCPAAGSAPCTPGGKLTIAPGTGAVRVTL